MANDAAIEAQAAVGGAPARRWARGLKRLAEVRVLSMLFVFVLLAIAFDVASHGIFFTPRNISLLLRQAAFVAIPAAGVAILIIMGEIDLSIGSAVYLCSVIAASLNVSLGMATLPVVLITIAAGMVLGVWQGFWVVRIAVPSFVVTLAGLLAFRGIGYYATNARTISPVSDAFSALSESFIPRDYSYAILGIVYVAALGLMLARLRPRRPRDTDQRPTLSLVGNLAGLTATFLFFAWAFGGFRGIPTVLIWVAAIGLVLWVLLTRTKFGRNTYLIGSNREAAVLAGIALTRHRFLGFVMMGVLYGIVGILITARLGSSSPTTGTYMELDAIAGAVIGGTSLYGGVGTITGAMLGAVLLSTIDNGMSILDVSSFLQLVVKGMVLLCALAFDAYMIRTRGR